MIRSLPALLACVGVAACGGAAHSHITRTHAPAKLGNVAAIADRCASQAHGDGAQMMLCLASNHVAVNLGEHARGCLSQNEDVVGCLRAASR
jgi:hypothetical protein